MTKHRGIPAAAAAILPLLCTAPVGATEGVTPQIAACKLISTAAGLQEIRRDPGGTYCLASDIDAGTVADFVPIGPLFVGKFFGNNYTIRNLTINRPTDAAVGLFRRIAGGAVVQDVRMENVNIIGGRRTGALSAFVEGGVTIKNIHVSGDVRCETPTGCSAGGIAGVLLESCFCETPAISESSASAAVAGVSRVGGAFGVLVGAVVSRVVATGPVTCLAANDCSAGGLVGHAEDAFVERSAATGAVAALLPATGNAGGLIGVLKGFLGYVQYGYSSGQVSGASSGVAVGGLVGSLLDAVIEQSLSVGTVTGGGAVGGLVANNPAGGAAVFDSYWDTLTSQQAGSAGGTGLLTNVLRGPLPVGLDSNWSTTPRKSYPFLSDADTPFTPALATLVKQHRVFNFLPISQLDDSQYATPPAHADAASLATVYTMIARAIGITKNVAALQGIKIDTRYWVDATQIAKWRGAVTTRATLGALTDIPAGIPLDKSNVIGAMRLGDLVILRGTFSSGGSTATHYMLGTLYTVDNRGRLAAVVAHDPWTGAQLVIDPNTKTVVAPSDFPLAGFTIDGYQPVTLN
jgi:hypothetical protein